MLLVLLAILGCGVLTSPKYRRLVAAWLRKRRLRHQARKRAAHIGEYCADIARRLHAGETLLQAMTANRGSTNRDSANRADAKFDSANNTLNEPICQLLDEHNRGVTLARAAARWAERDGTEETALLRTAVVLATQQVGADPALFDHVARTISSREELLADAHVQVAQARASIWVVAALPWAIAVVLVAEGGVAAQVLLGTTLGRFCIFAAVVMELTGIGWMRWLINRAVP